MYNVHTSPTFSLCTFYHLLLHTQMKTRCPYPLNLRPVSTISTATPLWPYGFQWDALKAFAVKRRCKREGGTFWPPLEDGLDVERDPYTAKPIWWGRKASEALESLTEKRLSIGTSVVLERPYTSLYQSSLTLSSP